MQFGLSYDTVQISKIKLKLSIKILKKFSVQRQSKVKTKRTQSLKLEQSLDNEK